MAKIYIIAGPPGIGKSTSGNSIVPKGIEILDPDLISSRYKAKGFIDYKDIGNIRFNELVRNKLFSENDFVIELNLGFQSHYDFVKSIKRFNLENTIDVILFFTDDIDLCLTRAELRHKAGLHLVKPKVIKEMYHNTMPLLQENFSWIDSIRAVSVVADEIPEVCLNFNKEKREVIRIGNQPSWVKNNLDPILKPYC